MMDRPVLNMTTGPVELSERTLHDGARQVLYHYDPIFVDLFAHTCAQAQRVFRTRHDVVIMQGEAMLGIEAAAAGLIAPGDRVLNLVSGIYGKGYRPFLRRYGAEVIELAVPYNESIDPQAVRDTLRRTPGIKFLSVVQTETPSGTVNPLKDICLAAKEHGAITIVDAVAGLGADPLHLEEWGIDLAVAGSQKCLGGPPGLALLAVSPAAWAAMEGRDAPLRGSYLSILDWKDSWIDNRRFPHAPSVSLIYGLESALAQVLEEGVERCVERHHAIGAACRAGIQAMDLRLWPRSEAIASAGVTALQLPAGIGDRQLQGHLRERYGVMIPNSEGELAGSVFRLGHMGRVAHPAYLAALLGVLEQTLIDLGVPIRRGVAIDAAMARLRAAGQARHSRLPVDPAAWGQV